MQLPRLEFLLHGVAGEDGHADAPQHGFLDRLVAAKLQGDLQVP